jgi:hypothetical protein
MLDTIRRINEEQSRPKTRKRNLLKEEEKKDSIAITNEPKFGQNTLQNQIDSFRQTVNNGARFSSENASEPENNPLVFFPRTGNLVFSGSIPTMSGLKFQYSLNDVTNAPYIFVDGLALTDDVINTLVKLRGHFLNWKDEFLAAGDLLDKLKDIKD